MGAADSDRLTIPEAARAFPGLTEAALRGAVSRKKLPASREGKLLTVSRGDVTKYLNTKYTQR
jgi:hypothetical protein